MLTALTPARRTALMSATVVAMTPTRRTATDDLTADDKDMEATDFLHDDRSTVSLPLLVRTDKDGCITRVVLPDARLKVDFVVPTKLFSRELEKLISHEYPLTIILEYLRVKETAHLFPELNKTIYDFIDEHKITTLMPSNSDSWQVKPSQNPDDNFRWVTLTIDFDQKTNRCRVCLAGNGFKYALIGFFLSALGMAEYFGFITDVVLGIPKNVAYAAIAADIIQTLAMCASSGIENTGPSLSTIHYKQSPVKDYELDEDFKVERHSKRRPYYLGALALGVLAIQGFNFYIYGYTNYNNQMNLLTQGYEAGVVEIRDFNSFILFAKINYFLDLSLGGAILLGMIMSRAIDAEIFLKRNCGKKEQAHEPKKYRVSKSPFMLEDKTNGLVSRIGKFSASTAQVSASADTPLLSAVNDSASPRRSACPNLPCAIL